MSVPSDPEAPAAYTRDSVEAYLRAMAEERVRLELALCHERAALGPTAADTNGHLSGATVREMVERCEAELEDLRRRLEAVQQGPPAFREPPPPRPPGAGTTGA
jgi:hypothetical protein